MNKYYLGFKLFVLFSIGQDFNSLAQVFVETESFKTKGGWLVDQ